MGEIPKRGSEKGEVNRRRGSGKNAVLRSKWVTPSDCRRAIEKTRSEARLKIIRDLYALHLQFAEDKKAPIWKGRNQNFTLYPSGHD